VPSKTVIAENFQYPEVLLLAYEQFKVVPGSAGVWWPFVPQKGSVEHSVGMMLDLLLGDALDWLDPTTVVGCSVVPLMGAARGGLSGSATLNRLAPTATATATRPAAATLVVSPRPDFALVATRPVADFDVAELAASLVAGRLAVSLTVDVEGGKAGAVGVGVGVMEG